MAITLTAPFTLIGIDGTTVVFDDLETLSVYCRNASIVVGKYHVEHGYFPLTRAYDGSYTSVRTHQWIVRDLMGRVVAEDDIPRIYAQKPRRWGRDWSDLKSRAAENGLPIPGTGRRIKRWGKTVYRNMRFLGAYRAAEAAEYDENDVRLNGRQNRHFPPNNWDDVPRRDGRNNSWKRYRRTRWREPAVSWRVVREDG